MIIDCGIPIILKTNPNNVSNARFDSMSKAELQRKAELCREYLIIFSLLEPGLTKWRGRVCEELARTLIKLEGR